MQQLELLPLPPERFDDLLPASRAAEFAATLREGREQLANRAVWHMSSTATGGGVAEMLQSVLCYLVGAKIEMRWLIVDGDDDFFVVTKRIHHMLHDQPGDGGPLGEAEHDVYLATLRREVGPILDRVTAGDVVFLHDPQTLGLAGPIRDAGAIVVWVCHVGADEPGEAARTVWRFLMPHVLRTNAAVFTRSEYVWDGLESHDVTIIPPCIDPFSPKNQPLDEETVSGILAEAEIVSAPPHDPLFKRADGETARVRSGARVFQTAPVPVGAPVVAQVSRWDPLKDHRGVMTAFADHVPGRLDAHLVLAGPSPDGVGDDPEGRAVFDELVVAWKQLPSKRRERVHIAALPMGDVDESAAMVNALQRYAAVVVQKSLAEGFGLTVAEAMWKERPVVGSRVGGIQDQIEDCRTGVLIDDPRDLSALGQALTELLDDRELAGTLAHAAREHVADHYLAPRYLTGYLRLTLQLL